MITIYPWQRRRYTAWEIAAAWSGVFMAIREWRAYEFGWSTGAGWALEESPVGNGDKTFTEWERQVNARSGLRG